MFMPFNWMLELFWAQHTQLRLQNPATAFWVLRGQSGQISENINAEERRCFQEMIGGWGGVLKPSLAHKLPPSHTLSWEYWLLVKTGSWLAFVLIQKNCSYIWHEYVFKKFLFTLKLTGFKMLHELCSRNTKLHNQPHPGSLNPPYQKHVQSHSNGSKPEEKSF